MFEEFRLGAPEGLALPSFDRNDLSQALKTIFCWPVLGAIGVIVAGKLLNQRLKLNIWPGQLFRIPVKGFFEIKATGPEVVLGFACYLICLLLLGATVGPGIEPWVNSHFGIDPGQFSALGFISSLSSVLLSFIVFVLNKPAKVPAEKKLLQEHDKIVNEITRKKTGRDPKKLPEVKQ